MKKTVFLALLFASSVSHAALVATGTTHINMMGSYTQFNGGDVIFRSNDVMGGCESGYFLSKSDAGFGATMAVLLSAYHAKSPVIVYALTDQVWIGSSGRVCKLYTVQLVQ